NPPSFLSWLGPLINRRLVQKSARSQTCASILARYDKAHTAMLATVEGMRDDEWGRGAYCFGAGYKTILDLCQMLPSHFQEHAAQIAASKRTRQVLRKIPLTLPFFKSHLRKE